MAPSQRNSKITRRADESRSSQIVDGSEWAVKCGRKKVARKVSSAVEELRQQSTSLRQRFLSLPELQDTMGTFARPVASSIAGVEFNVYSNEEIKKLSVKRIHNTPTLDTFNNPVPGGLYDPAMGAWGDHV